MSIRNSEEEEKTKKEDDNNNKGDDAISNHQTEQMTHMNHTLQHTYGIIINSLAPVWFELIDR